MTPLIESSRTQSPNEWLAIASAELRTVRRLARTWVIVALAGGLVGSSFYFHSYFHHSFPGAVSRIDLPPRFSWTDINHYVLWLFMAGVVFLAFDTRHRDEQSGICEALDSRPLSNLNLFAGRLCGVAAATLAALLAVSVLLQVAATLGGAFGWAIYSIEPVSMLTFLVVDAIPALVAWCAVVLLLVAVIGNRLVVVIVALALLGLHMWAEAHVPVYLLPAVSLLHIDDNWASDLAPRFADAQTYLHRGSLLLAAGGLLAWTAALHGRPDGVSRTTRGMYGALLVVLGVGGIAMVALRCIEDLDMRAVWSAAHERAQNIPSPLVRHVGGVVHINPERLGLDLEMQLTAPPHADLSNLVFSFNPGLEVAALRVDNEATPFSHELGLLKVELPEPLAAGSPATLTLQAEGLPDADFAYLDSAIDWRVRTVRNRILQLGTSAGIFASRYVALMPALRWLPVPGPNLDGASRGYLPTIDLSVAVPDGWLVAGPGRREADDAGRFRFRPVELAASLLGNNDIPFPGAYSVYDLDVDDEIGTRLFPIARFLTASRRIDVPGFSPVLSGTGRPRSWERLLGASLADLDMRREPATAVEARSLRVKAAFRSIGDTVGRRPTAAFLAALRNRHTGAAFDANDFDDAAADAGIDLEALLGDWISEAALPGFVTSRAHVSEIADTEGNVRFQTLVHVRNGEGVPGLVRLSTGDHPATVTDPIQVPGNTTMEVGMVTDEAPAQLWLEPYLALNRGKVWIDIVNETSTPSPPVPAPLTGARPSVWLPHVEGFVVDDLDPGFAVERRSGQHPVADGSRQTLGGNTADLDQGLPTPGAWYRVSYPTSWGRYRHTVAGTPAGDGSQVALFAADLPTSGRWRLDFYLPDPQPPGWGWPPGSRSYSTLGTFDMKLAADGKTTPLLFDGAVAETGWNEVGEFEFAATQVRLEISSRTDGEMVIADAIRWVPLGGTDAIAPDASGDR